MSDAHNQQQSLIQTPKQLIAAVAGFFLVIVIGIILLVIFVTNKPLQGAGAQTSEEAVAVRVRPVAEEGFVLKDINAPKVLQAGNAVFTAVCAACHGAGIAGAPKVGDNGAWGARLAQGYDTLVQHAVQGIRAMPAKGGNPDLDDVEVARAVVYMANQSGAKFKEPEVPAAGAAAAGTTEAGAAPAGAAPAQAAAPSAPALAAATPTSPTVTPPATNVAATTPAAVPAAGAATGKALYSSACIACHGAGIAGAPKFGDKGAWAARIAQGSNVLYEHAIKGFQGKNGVMPPKGGSSAPDGDVRAAVDYMVAAAK
ncbi:cytochrome c5 family protein [Massilia forsythiae]|uniref:Cytochrome c5 family protein n=1 Tax=Massilia forsythiae TaxID=2728020 RepID=A0A7Z2ZTE4_9BURK|nr:c-type cytochrome [Massilia forsythiae]QJD99906.1 cytochrome c5 family protein [Massilia forsythiae]